MTNDTTQAAGAAVQAISDLVATTALPALVDLVDAAKADLRRELLMHLEIIGLQDKQLEEQRKTIDLLVRRLDEAEQGLAELTIGLGFERTLSDLRNDDLKAAQAELDRLREAHNGAVMGVRGHGERLTWVAVDLDELRRRSDGDDLRIKELRADADMLAAAQTEAESRIADLEDRVYGGDEAIESSTFIVDGSSFTTAVPDWDLPDSLTSNWSGVYWPGIRVAIDPTAPDSGAFTAPAGTDTPESFEAFAARVNGTIGPSFATETLADAQDTAKITAERLAAFWGAGADDAQPADTCSMSYLNGRHCGCWSDGRRVCCWCGARLDH